MANEITTKTSLRFVKGSVDITFPPDGVGLVSVDVSGSNYQLGTQVLSTTPAALKLGSVVTPGLICIRNNSSTAGEIARLKTSTSGVVFAKILPGQMQLFKWDENLTAPFVLSDTGTPQIEYLLVEA